MSMKIEPANPAWPDDFAVLKRAVLRAAPAGAIIHHIGSTAVAGLPAKDVVDMQLTVDDLALVDRAAMEAQGRGAPGTGQRPLSACTRPA